MTPVAERISQALKSLDVSIVHDALIEIIGACTMPTEFTMEDIMLAGKAYRHE
jgi:hypothetical protein